MKRKNTWITALLAMLATLSIGLTASCATAADSSSQQSSASSASNSEANSSVGSSEDNESENDKDSSSEVGGENNSSEIGSEDSSSDSAEENSSDSSSEKTEHDVCVWGEWELAPNGEATCTEEGTKIRYCIYDDTHTQTENFAARGHAYTQNNGYCVSCNELATIPSLENGTEFPLIEVCAHTDAEIEEGLCDCVYKGRGEDYNRLSLTEGTYTVEIGANNDIWLSFSVREAGQYMLYSVGGTVAKASRHDASAHYIPMNGDNYVGVDARETDGNFYSYVSCTKKHFNAEWRATYRIRAAQGTLVKIRFVKIGDPVWEPESQYEKVYPTQINGKKAAEPTLHSKKTPVEYDSDYFYSDPKDGGDGYYHLGTKDNPGAIIYVAINSAPSRLLLNGTFSTVHYEGSALNLNDGYTAEGNYRIKNYVPFIMNSADDDNIFATDENGNYLSDPNKNCYQNYCNSDGLYPVNQELFEFLNLYVKNTMPIDQKVTLSDWKNQEDWLWLSACYYYKEIAVGTAENPLALCVGTETVALPAADIFYCEIQEAGVYKITCADSEVMISVNGGDYVTQETTITVEDTPISVCFASMEAKDVAVTLEKIE